MLSYEHQQCHKLMDRCNGLIARSSNLLVLESILTHQLHQDLVVLPMILIQEKLCTNLFSFRKTLCEVSAAGMLDWLAGPAAACQAVPKKFQ
jgi:hypothetical protein